MTDTIRIDRELALTILEALRLTPVWTLLGSEFEHELGGDFKPEKWLGHEKGHAEVVTDCHRRLQAACTEQMLGRREPYTNVELDDATDKFAAWLRDYLVKEGYVVDEPFASGNIVDGPGVVLELQDPTSGLTFNIEIAGPAHS